MMGRIADKNLAQAGKRAHVWARAHMTIFDYILKAVCTEQATIGNKACLLLTHYKRDVSARQMRTKVRCANRNMFC